MQIQWYPGHMTKARRAMQEDLKLVDLVMELTDARAPLAGRNPDIDKLAAGKARMIFLNKADLADDQATLAWMDYFRKKGITPIRLDARKPNFKKAVVDGVKIACQEKIERDRRKGILNRPIRAMVVGIPNVGKSTFLSRVTNAQPKIANYHFTTLTPNLGVVDLDGTDGFVIADIPGLIEGASEGVGLGHQFLRHIERTRVMIHIVDAASTEGRDPVDDVYKINAELKAYNADIASRPQVIAANKVDVIYPDGEDPIQRLKDEFEPQGVKVFPISAVTGKGVKELLYHVKSLLDSIEKKQIIFEQEFFPEDVLIAENLPYTVEKLDDGHTYVVEGPKIEKMLGYTNLDSEKGFAFFQKFLKDGGILEELEQAGIEEGDTVRMYGFEFDYYK